MRSTWPGLAVLGLTALAGCTDLHGAGKLRQGDRVSPTVPIVGCTSAELARSILGMAAAGDLEAYRKAFLEHGTRGECDMLTVDRAYFVVDVPLTGYLAKVRQEGQTVEFWTERGVMKKR